mmetsp:Transcript_2994/g.7266  ORF Transcript_2994/g.7266 Transcript_2994/m.7266 type:complete len:760 (+) Transcript_2994:466-2745(+)|eukprot:CAMPEP_0206441836 /NCGR_PEP_ID=MMETSP0324_2-20121206/13493_1 /ASSEMBLY_ACC=CAM_ASM_000836 /TAXON_ID=2866 /ORGANISM="Crypthecodinium cohnii, Strain Seligo" /LENGTH=759 /DNA_ID=CAMNT_0053909623 /DNA_START=453 /DNA_END=2732 /DNA_ORIENTATION=-
MSWTAARLVGYFSGVFVVIILVGITDVIALQWNEASIQEEHRLTVWYLFANAWSSLLGFYCQAILPWSVGLKGRMRHWIQVCLWLWCVGWDQCMRVWWLYHERAARAAGHEPSRQQMLLWAIGNDLNSLILIPFVFIYLPRRCRWARAKAVRQEQQADNASDGTPPPRDAHDLLVGCCAVMALALIVLDLPVYQHIRDSWGGHLGRLFICPVLYVMPRLKRPSVITCVYGYVLLQNLTMDWSWATIRIIQGQQDQSSPLGPMSVVVYSVIWQALYTTAGNLIVLSGLPRRGATILLLMFFFWSEYLLMMLLVDTGKFNFNFFAALGLKLIRKPMIFHPGMAKSLRHFYRYKLRVRWLVPNFPREKEMDDMLLLSHVCSIMSTSCAALLLLSFRFLPWKKDPTWSVREYRMPLTLISITLASEVVIFGLTILGARAARMLDSRTAVAPSRSQDRLPAHCPSSPALPPTNNNMNTNNNNNNTPLLGGSRGRGSSGGSGSSNGSASGGRGGGAAVAVANGSAAVGGHMNGSYSHSCGSFHPIAEGCQSCDCLVRNSAANNSASLLSSNSSTTATTNNLMFVGDSNTNTTNPTFSNNLNSNCNSNTNIVNMGNSNNNLDSHPSGVFGHSLTASDIVLPSFAQEPRRLSNRGARSSFSMRVEQLQACLPRLLDWSPDLEWWVRFLGKTCFLWAACLGLCVERSNEKLLHSASDFLPPKTGSGAAATAAADQFFGAGDDGSMDIINNIGLVLMNISQAAASSFLR